MKNFVEHIPPANLPRSLLTVNQLSEKHPFVSQGSLRYLIFNSKLNGLEAAGALVRLGRRVLIDEEKFFEWIDSKPNLELVRTKGKKEVSGG